MGKIAFVFPGQASQYSGMGRELAAACPEAADIFRRADAALGFSISDMCFEGTEEQLKLTENTQPAILTVSVAVHQALRARGLKADFVAGHSLGEYSAIVAAEGLPFEEAVQVVRKRGQFMQEAVPVGVGAMAAVLGGDLETIRAACDSAAQGQVVAPANINCTGQIVIAGHREAVDRATAALKDLGIRKIVALPVSAPFHCPLMQPAQERLAPELNALSFRNLSVPLVANVDASLRTVAAEVRDGLVRQVTGAVLWQQSVERLSAEGVDVFVEVGPKNVLSGMIKKIAPGARIFPVEKPAEIEALVAEIGA